jgi:tetratricopeptide (TPR) repeat protein
LDLDLPAPKPNAGASKYSGPRVGLGTPVAASAAKIAPPLSDFDEPLTGTAGLQAMPGLGSGAGLELDDLPAPKVTPAKPKPLTDLDDGLDLPAPKPTAGKAKAKIAPAFGGAPSFGNDPPTGMRAPLPPAFPDLGDPLLPELSDLPARKGDLPAASKTTAELPPVKAAPEPPAAPSLDIDLPAPKPVQPKGAFSRPGGAPAQPKRAEPTARTAAMPKDSLAMDPEPFFAGGKMAGPLADLDDFAPANAQVPENVDLPAPREQLPVAKAGVPKPAAARKATTLGLGGKLPKDSLDVPGGAQGFAQVAEITGLPFANEGDLPAHADLPAPKGFAAELPAPNDLPRVKAGPSGVVDLPGLNDLPRMKGEPGVVDLPGLNDLPRMKGEPGVVDLPGLNDLPRMKGEAGIVDLPAPNDLPRMKGEPGLVDLPAPNDLPRMKGEPGLVDLPAPNDLPVSKLQPPQGTAMGIGPMTGNLGGGQVPNELGGTDMGLGPMMLDASLDLPPSAPANEAGGGFGMGDFDLPDGGGGFGGNGFGAGTFGGSPLDVGLDLPPARNTRAQDQSNSLIDLNSLALPTADARPPKAPFGATMDLSADDLGLPDARGRGMSPPSMDRTGGGLPLPSMGDLDLFGDTGGPAPKPSRGQTIELDGMFELGSSVAVDSIGTFGGDQAGAASFGELDFGLNNDAPAAPMPMPAPMPQPMPQGPGGFDTSSVEAELLGGAEAPAPRTKKKRKARAARAVPAWVWPIVLVLVIAGTGVGLGLFTEHGYFGMYFVERLLAAGDPVRVSAAIESAEKQAKTDTYVDVRKSLVTLSDARNEAGLNRELLARSLLHEALYQLRFGEDAQSSQRSVAILARVMERGGNVPGLTLARAADTARRGEIPQAAALLKTVPKDKDPYRSLVAGEIALLEKKYDVAQKAFAEAEKLGAMARARWGIARSLMALEKTDEANAAAKATLELSPRHSGALVLLAELALERGDAQTAIEDTKKATGSIKIDGVAARPSKRDVTRAWALMGKIEEKLEHPKAAQEAYQKALAADPLRVDVLIGSGRMLMRLGQPREALSRFDSAISAKPPEKPDADGRIPLLEAATGATQALLALERPQEGLARLTGLGSFADHPLVTLWQGHCFVALEKWEEAEAAYNKSIEKAPDKFAGYVAMSQLLFKRDRPEEAARVLNEATGKVADSAEVRRMLGNSELTRHHLPEAIHQFRAAIRFDPRDAGALHGLVVALRKTGAIDEAVSTLDKLEKVDPSFPALPLERGQLLEMQGDYESAIAVYRKAIKDRPTDADLRLRLGAALVTADQIDEADTILKQVLKERPSSAEAEHFVGRVLFARRDTAQAVQRFQRAVAIDNTQPEYHMFLAWALLEQGNLSGALDSVNKALERDPNLGDAHWILGRIQLRTGAVKDALESFLKTRKLKPGRVEVLANIGDAYDQLRQLEQAVDAYKEATRARPEEGEWWYRLGSLQLDRGNLDEARVSLQESVLRGDRLFEKPRWLADAHRLYADMLRQGGRPGEALEHYKLFLSLAPADHPSRPEIDQIVKSSSR